MIECQIAANPGFKFIQHFLITTGNPACGINIDRLKLAVDTIFVLETVSHNIELKHQASIQPTYVLRHNLDVMVINR